MQKKNIVQALHWGRMFLKKAGISSHDLDARLILQDILEMSHEKLIINHEKEVSSEDYSAFEKMISQRSEHRPIAYLLRKKEFYGLEFNVSEDVLIPRPDSECLVDAVLENFGAEKNLKILDLGTGSGCLAISIFKNLENAEMVAVDFSEKALEIARQNAQKLGANVTFIQSDWFESLPKKFLNHFDIIVSNPPYVSRKDLFLMNEETKFEPESALFADQDGMMDYEKICASVPFYLKENGKIFFEFGANDEEKIAAILEKCGLEVIKFQKDLSGIKRCVIAKIKYA